MKPYTINFYNGSLGKESYLCSCLEQDFMSEPNIGDMISLPIDAMEEDKDVYVVKQKNIEGNCINYFCTLYNWEM